MTCANRECDTTFSPLLVRFNHWHYVSIHFLPNVSTSIQSEVCKSTRVRKKAKEGKRKAKRGRKNSHSVFTGS